MAKVLELSPHYVIYHCFHNLSFGLCWIKQTEKSCHPNNEMTFLIAIFDCLYRGKDLYLHGYFILLYDQLLTEH